MTLKREADCCHRHINIMYIMLLLLLLLLLCTKGTRVRDNLKSNSFVCRRRRFESFLCTYLRYNNIILLK
jgi:hypothetical protein